MTELADTQFEKIILPYRNEVLYLWQKCIGKNFLKLVNLYNIELFKWSMKTNHLKMKRYD
jgi:hypothetical protein